jgi:hypothetical protein
VPFAEPVAAKEGMLDEVRTRAPRDVERMEKDMFVTGRQGAARVAAESKFLPGRQLVVRVAGRGGVASRIVLHRPLQQAEDWTRREWNGSHLAVLQPMWCLRRQTRAAGWCGLRQSRCGERRRQQWGSSEAMRFRLAGGVRQKLRRSISALRRGANPYPAHAVNGQWGLDEDGHLACVRALLEDGSSTGGVRR